MPVTTVNGLNLYFERAGSGPPLLFISGTGGDLRNKPNVFDGPLAKAFELLSYDQRGLGQSEKPDLPCAMADYANDAAALVSLAKTKASETLRLCGDEGVQMHGGIGMTDEHEIGFFLKRARVAEATFGNAAFHRDRYASLMGY